MRRNALIAVSAVSLVGVLAACQAVLQKEADMQASAGQAPRFEVDPLWPKPLPNHWVMGRVVGVWADERDNVWIVHTGNNNLDEGERALELKTGECCTAAPPVLAFDPAGNLIHSWGGPGTGEWPQSIHGIHVDYRGNVWIGGNGEKDSQVLKLTQEGKLLMQVGKFDTKKGSNDTENFGRVAKIWVDPKANEAYIADGYRNKRVAVLDADTGRMKRYWGAYGNKPDDTDLGKYNPAAPPSQQFRNPVHCVERANDGLVYVCDRQADRVQVFQPDGKFVKEAWFAKQTLGSGSTWDLAFSRDANQTYLFMADGTNEKVRVIVRDTLQEVTSFGDGGRQPGQFFGVHSIAIDSKGNLFTTETFEGKRVQRFVYKGMAPVAKNQGVVWPRG